MRPRIGSSSSGSAAALLAGALSGFISECGLLQSGAPLSLKQLYGRYRRGPLERSIRSLRYAAAADLSLEDQWLLKYSLPIPIWFQGVWDTVGALGVPFGRIPLLSRSSYAFLRKRLANRLPRLYTRWP